MERCCDTGAANRRVWTAVEIATVGALLETFLLFAADVLSTVDVDRLDYSITPPTPAGGAGDAVFPAPAIERLEAARR